MKCKIIFLLRLIAAGILIQTLYFKFTGAPESIYIFTQVGMEPWGRWFSGVSELAASILLLVPSTQSLGALMGAGVMMGALASHALILGIVVQNDGGLLFSLACVVFVACTVVAVLRRDQLHNWIHFAKNLVRQN